MIGFGLPVSIIIIVIGIALQGETGGFSPLNALLFIFAAAIFGGAVIGPIISLLGPKRKVVLTEDELQLIEGSKQKTAKYAEIKNVKLNKNQLLIKLPKGKIQIIAMHGYPLSKIHQSLQEQLDRRTQLRSTSSNRT